jgi:hypothetical protein
LQLYGRPVIPRGHMAAILPKLEVNPMNTLIARLIGFVLIGAIVGTLFGWEGWLSFAIGTVFADLAQPSPKFPVIG